MTVLITLTQVGSDVGPLFDLYENSTGSFLIFMQGKLRVEFDNVPITVPDFATVIRVQSTGECDNYKDITITPSTTTTTSSTSTTTTTTTCIPLYSVELRIGETELAACEAPAVTYYMDTAIFGTGSYIFTDICGDTPISAVFVILHNPGTGYECTINQIGNATGNSC